MSSVSVVESPVITPQPAESGAQRVLVVDADPSTRSILEVALKRSGFDVATATTGREAFDTLTVGKLPNVVVLSSDLHGEDGYSLCAQLRGDTRTEHLPVLLLARHDEEERLALAEAVGADDLVAKPAFARDIASLVLLRIAPKDTQGYSLDTAVLPLPLATRALLSAQRGGQIRLSPKVFIAFRGGRITHAELDGTHGMDALVRILTLAKGTYRVSFTLPATVPNLDASLRELVSGIFPRVAKWDALAGRSVPLDERFQVDFAALSKALPTIPDAVNDVVRLFDGQRSVRQVLFDSPLNETVTLEVANRLHLMGVVKPFAQAEPAELDFLKTAPKLFEPQATEAAERMTQLFGGTNPDAIVTPRETPAVRAGDWYEKPLGTGLDVEDPTEGWQVGSHVAEDIQAQLSAFNIQSEVEESEPKPASAEVAAFTGGTQSVEPTPMEQAMAPIQLTDVLHGAPAPTAAVVERQLEESFFDAQSDEQRYGIATPDDADYDDEKTPPSGNRIPVGAEAAVPAEIEETYRSPRLADAAEAAFFGDEDDQEPTVSQAQSVADAVLGPTPDAPADAQSSRLMAIAAGAVLALAALGILGWRITASDDAPPPPAPVAAVEEAPAPDPVMHLDAPEMEEAAPVAPADFSTSEALAAAKKLYETGKLKEALAALDQVVATEASSVLAWQLTGLARYDNGDNRGAEEAARTVIALAPDYADAYLLLATMHLDQGKKDDAKVELQKYLDLAPNGEHANEAKHLLTR
jgi:CheY-like chemotaxis protein